MDDKKLHKWKDEAKKFADLKSHSAYKSTMWYRYYNKAFTELIYEAGQKDARRKWVGLTPEEVKEISLANRPYVVDMVVALEARLKQKNGYDEENT